MKFTSTSLAGAFLIELEPVEDERGFFARTFCTDEFKKHGIDFACVQCNISYNKKKGTLRGMHYQAAPHEEAKIVSCVRGSIFDVIVDIRPNSPTYKKWYGAELSAKNHSMLYVPKGFAHGFQTLEDDAEVFYMMGEYYHEESARGMRWDDPEIGIKWLSSQIIISKKDSEYQLFGRNSG
ncbi:MAG TPA: dTDP-4-dehydrorhamnose 3,5-epimerase [Chitinivibrionales bacterium]|nr:dTDP-4-dehydrorhamnose 3,5-epimerase [Chitinivibrionales bacterium]